MNDKKQIPVLTYSRVSGYYNPVSQFNKGKQEEFHDRKMINIEANGLQYLFVEQFEKASMEKALYLPYNGINNQTNKEMKIAALAPKFKQGYLYIHKNLRGLRNELLSFPKGSHDDQMDSLCLAIQDIFTQINNFSFGSIEKPKRSGWRIQR